MQIFKTGEMHHEIPHPSLSAHLLISFLHFKMPRDVIVPKTVKGIEEVVIKHTKTKRGTIRTTEKVVPVSRPQKARSGESSRSKKGAQPPTEPERAGRSAPAGPDFTPGDTLTDPYMVEQEYDLPDSAEDSQPHPQATVCNTLQLHEMGVLI